MSAEHEQPGAESHAPHVERSGDASSAANGFAKLAGLNLLIPALAMALTLVPPLSGAGGWVIVPYPLLHFAWSLPLIARERRAGRTHAANGMKLAAALTFLASSGCWVTMLVRFRV